MIPEYQPRRNYLLRRLREADGPAYDELCAWIVGEFPHRSKWVASTRGVQAVRDLFSDGLAITERDESVWLTPEGWQAEDTKPPPRHTYKKKKKPGLNPGSPNPS